MNIVHIIGNGFDLNLNLATRYADFLKFYKSTESQEKVVVNLKNNIDSCIQNWSDLELEFGRYTKNFKDANEFDIAFEDLIDRLADYLTEQEDKFDVNNYDCEKFKTHLSFPELLLSEEDKSILRQYKNINTNKNYYVSLITLNYTSTLEKILNFDNKEIKLHDLGSGRFYTLKNLIHLHGNLNERMIVGVNDLTQIENEDFHDIENVTNALIKSNNNKGSKSGIESKSKSLIETANLICIFGSSIGDTDLMWWNLIGKRLLKDCNLIIFEKCDKLTSRHSHKFGREYNRVKNTFIQKTGLNNDEKEKIKDKIFVGINTRMFSLFKS